MSAVETFRPEWMYPSLAVIRPPTVADPTEVGEESWGSGFFAGTDGLLFTAAHVLESESGVPFKTVWVCVWNRHSKDWVDCQMVPVDPSLIDSKNDIGIVIVPPPIPAALPLSLDVHRGDDIVVVGFSPRETGVGFKPNVIHCFIPAHFPMLEIDIVGSRQQCLALHYAHQHLLDGIRVEAGMSGGPCIDILRGAPRVVAVEKIGMPQNELGLPYVLSTPVECARALFMRLPPHMERPFPEVGTCPYQGLKAFSEQSAKFFFGREDLSRRLLEKLLGEQSLIAVIGPSGSGKSSVVHSGLVPLLRHQELAESWNIVSFVPGSRPFHQLAMVLMPILEHFTAEELGGRLASDKGEIVAIAEKIIHNSNGADRLVFIIDQFEELITHTPPEVSRAFVEAMVAAIGHGRLKFLLTLRADYYGHVIALNSELSRLLETSIVNVGPMSRDEMEDAIVKPAKLVRLDFEPGLVQRFLNDVGKESGRLPLLQFALTQLWERRSERLMTHAGYKQIGGISKAISDSAHIELQTFNAKEQSLVRMIFTRLVRLAEPGQALEDTRQRVLRKDFDPAVRPIINKLAQARLLTTDGETVEITHEALIREWTDLQTWLNEDREFLLWRQRLKLLLAEWRRANRDNDSVLRGAALSEAERWHASRNSDLNEEEREFIASGSQLRRKRSLEEERRRRSHVRNLAVGLAITLAFAAVAAAQWYRASHERRVAQARTLLSPAILMRSTQPAKLDLAALLAIESMKLDETEEATSLLREAVALLPVQLAQFQTDCDGKMKLSPGGGFLACLNKTRLSVRVISLSNRKDIFQPPITENREISEAAASPDGQFLGFGFRSGGFKLFHVETGKLLISAGEGSDARITFSSNGQYFAAAASDASSRATIRLFSVKNGVAPFKQFQTEYPILALNLSPDGRFLGALHQGKSGTEVTLFDGTTGNRLTIEGGAAIPSFAVSAGAALITLPYLDNTVRVKDTRNNGEIVKLTHGQVVNAVAISENGKYVASGGEDGVVQVMETDTGRLIAMIPLGSSVESLEFTANNDLVLATGAKTVRTVNVLRRPAFTALPASGVIGISPRGAYLTTFSGASSSELAIMDRLGEKVWQLKAPRDLLYGAVQYSRDESVFVATAGGYGMTAYDLKAHKQFFKPTADTLLSEAISDDGRTIAWATPAKLEIFRIDDSRTDRLPFNNSYLLALSGDGKLVAAAGQNPSLTVFNVDTKAKIFEVQLGSRITKATFTPDSRYLAVSGEDQSLFMYQIPAGQAVWQLKHAAAGLLLFNEDGSLLATGGGQPSFDVQLLETATGKLVFNIKGRVQPVGAAFSSDGRYVEIVDDTSLMRHFLRTSELVQQTCALVTRGLGQEEVKAFMGRDMLPATCPARP